jgi:hypothetical protein
VKEGGMGDVDSKTEAKVNKALYALLGLTVSGVVAFAAYIVADLSGDVERCRSMLVEIHKEIAEIHAVHARRGEQIEELKRQVVEMHQAVDKRW